MSGFGTLANATAAMASLEDMSIPEEGPFKRTEPIHYGWSNGSLDRSDSNALAFFDAKNYGAPYFWASMVSLARAITHEVYTELLVALGEIRPEFATNKTADELIDAASDEQILRLWDSIFYVVNYIREGCDNKLDAYVTPSGCVSFKNKTDSWHDSFHDWNVINTPPTPIGLMENYINFISLIGENRKITIADSHTARETTLEQWLPIEGLATSGNQNFTNAWGGNQYLASGDLETYYSLTEFTRQEFDENNSMPIKKNTSPLGFQHMLLEPYQAFVSRHGTLYNHLHVLETTLECLQNFQTFVTSFDVTDRVSELFSSDFFNSEIDLPRARYIIDQIIENKPKYLVNRNGIQKRHEYVNLPTNTDGNWEGNTRYSGEYIYSLGIPESTYAPANADGIHIVKVRPKIITENTIYYHNEIQFYKELQCLGVDNEGVTHYKYIDAIYSQEELLSILPSTIDSNSLNTLQESAELRNWLLYYLDLDFDESAFLTDPSLVDAIYSPTVIENESNTFLWTSENFSEGIPSIELDTTFNISPLIFPVNMFHDICAPRKFHQVVHASVNPANFVDSGGNTYPNAAIVGSVEWEYTH